MGKVQNVNLGAEKTKSIDPEMDAIAEFEAREEELRNEMVNKESSFKSAEDKKEEEELGQFKKDQDPIDRNTEDEQVKAFKGYTIAEFPIAENEMISLYECFVPTSTTDKNGKEYKDYLRKYEDTYELHMYGKVWRWKATDYEREEKVIFRKTIAYILRSVDTSKNYLFVPKTNQLFPIF